MGSADIHPIMRFAALALRGNGAVNDGIVGTNGQMAETQNFASLQPGNHVNWYALSPAQIAQLQAIAERNTGRASVMAKGRAVQTRFIAPASSQTATVDMRNVPAGVYMLRVTDAEGNEYHQKIIKK